MKIITNEKAVEEVLTRGVENIYPNKPALKKLLTSGKKIKLYCGFDPTSPTLHIGNGATIRKMAKFLDLGHEVIFLFGDFTAQIGDPDKLSVRKPLTHEQVMNNLKNWKKQIKNIINVDKVIFKFNSKWLAGLVFKDLINIASNFTAQQMLAREMFQQRIKEERPIYLHEFLYPLMQAYDSVAMDVDLEIGGNDQTFNMLAGRTLMKAMTGKEKCVLTTKLLEDPTGKKMGKTEGNMITLEDEPADMYGKVMSWPDTMITMAMEILTDIPMEEIKAAAKAISSGANPRDYKMKLAYEVVKTYLGEAQARHGQLSFERVFQNKEKPLDIPEVKIKDQDGKIGVLDLFVAAGLAKSNSEVRRLVKERAIRVDDELIHNENLILKIPAPGMLLQRGKKQFVKVKIK